MEHPKLHKPFKHYTKNTSYTARMLPLLKKRKLLQLKKKNLRKMNSLRKKTCLGVTQASMAYAMNNLRKKKNLRRMSK